MSMTFSIETVLPSLTTQRLKLRWLTDQDVPALFTIFGDKEVTRYWGHSVLPDLVAAAELLADIHSKFGSQTLFQWGIALLETDLVIGTCSLASLNPENRRAELGFALARNYWRQGYISEALPALLQFAFCGLHLHRSWADTDPRNVPSIRTLEKLGFRQEGILREHYLLQGEPQHALVYGLLQSDSRFEADTSNPEMPNKAPEPTPRSVTLRAS
jgi:RimJ/RimL family protein N-acetyltransferase